MRITDKHVLFWGGVFSNFYPSPFIVDDLKFETSEQFFMYHKALHFKDDIIAEKILTEGIEPKIAKKLGRKVNGFDEDEWTKVRFDVMYNAIFHKFTQNETLKKELLSYNNRTFVECSPFDKIWGIGISQDDINADNEKEWKGLNLLGKCLTKLRNEIKNAS